LCASFIFTVLCTALCAARTLAFQLRWRAPTAPTKHATTCQRLSIANVAKQTLGMERIPPRRRRGGRRKGERHVAVLNTADLFELFGCNDINVLLAMLGELGVKRYVAGYAAQRVVIVSDYKLPEEMRARAKEIATASSGWVGE
jgi:hypothetical protein